MKRPCVIGSYLISVAGYLAVASLWAYLRRIQLDFALLSAILPFLILALWGWYPVASLVWGAVLLLWCAALVWTIVAAVRKSRKRPLILSHILLFAYWIVSFLLMLVFWAAATHPL
jgi:hypothetical protein